MYCSNCGKQLKETANFCSICGKPVEKIVEKLESVDREHLGHTEEITGQSKQQTIGLSHNLSYSPQIQQFISSNNVYSLISLVVSGLLIILMFTKWYEVPIFSYANSFFDGYINLPSKFSIIDFFTHFMSIQKIDIPSIVKDVIGIYMFANLLLWIAILVCLVYYIKIMLKDKEKNIETFETSVVLIIIIVVINFVTMIIINVIGSNKEMEATGIEIVKLNFGVYLMAFISITSKFILVNKVKEEIQQGKNKEAV